MSRLVSLLAIVIAGTGCMEQDGDLSDAEARQAGDALGAGIEDSATSFGPMTGGASLDAACATLSGNTADTDQDNIPANATLTLNCTTMAFGYTGTLIGTGTVIDNQPSAIAWDFAATTDLQATLTGPFGGTIVRDWSGDIAATQASALGPFTLARTLDAVTVFTGAGGNSTTVTEANDWTITYTPQASWTPGGLVVTGSLAASGTWDLTVDAKEAKATLATPTPLTINPACASRVTGGTITGSYEGLRGVMREISVTWTGCGARVVTYTEP